MTCPKHPALIAELIGEAAQVQMMSGTCHATRREKGLKVLDMVANFSKHLLEW